LPIGGRPARGSVLGRGFLGGFFGFGLFGMTFGFLTRVAALRIGAALLVVFFAGLRPATLSGQDAISILERAAERYRAMDGFCAEFRQAVQNDLLRQTTRSRGELCQARSDRFEMRFSEPEGDRVVADGNHVWVYFPSADPGQVFRTSLGATGGRFDIHQEFLSEPGRRYAPTLEGTEEVDGRTTYVLFLEPLRPSPYLRARIWVDTRDFLIRKAEITEDEGFVRVVELSEIRVNPVIPEGRFRFDPPAGVQVIVR
jgi:outer membrane lipoprotein carrier protein